MIDPAIIGSIAEMPRSRSNDSGEGGDPEPPPGICGPGRGGSDGVPCGNAGDSVAAADVLTDPAVTGVTEAAGSRVLTAGAAVEGGGTTDVRLGQPLGLGVAEGSMEGSPGCGVVGGATVGRRLGTSDGTGRGGASIGGDWVGCGWSLLGSG